MIHIYKKESRKKMKKQVAAITLLTLGGALMVGQAAHAEDPTTNGTVQFSANSNGTGGLIKPGTPGKDEDKINVSENEGASSSGSLRLTNVPYFKFGKVIVSSTSTSYPSLLSTYQKMTKGEDGTLTPDGKDVKIPQFVQVVDERGDKTGVFKVTAKATNFTEQNVADGKTADVLENTRIQFYSQALTNNTLPEGTDISTMIEGLPTSTLSTKAIAELSPTTDLQILKTASAGSANASVSSVVFDSSYAADKDDVYNTAKDSQNPAVKLYVPAGESPKSDVVYSSTITWMLSNTL